jgi:diadenosine tetraphosphate (Ap4A) HIT family hydrolase
MNDCLFCKIANNLSNSYTIYEDEIVKVFLDIYPEAPGHLILIPKKHILDVNDIDDDTFKYFNGVIKRMHELLKEKLNIDGLKIQQNNGIAQAIKHYHIHLVPVNKVSKEYSLEEVYKILTEE